MKKGSLVGPSPKFLRTMPEFLMFGYRFLPDIPTKDSIYVCASDPYFTGPYQCIDLVELTVYRKDGKILSIDTCYLIELQGPEEVNVDEIVEESTMVLVENLII